MELKYNEFLSVKYHDIFDYPLKKEELEKWQASSKIKVKISEIENKKGFYFLKGRQNIINKRLKNEKYSKNKLKIAKKAANIISKIPAVLFVGITGSLAMMNAKKESDIDLLIITKEGKLWTTRLFVYVVLRVTGYGLRVPKQENEKDKLCINMWLDESALGWSKKDRNIYTAHEVLQIVPIYEKGNIHETFLNKNKWCRRYWPNAVPFSSRQINETSNINSAVPTQHKILFTFEMLAFKLQYLYMKKKITHEVITPTTAIFHPNDWGNVVIKKIVK